MDRRPSILLQLARHGLLSPALRERVVAGVVAPEALLAGAGWERPDTSLAADRADRVM